MPNIAAVLKDEIRRLARKEIRAETSKTKRAVALYRREIARLKRQLDGQGKQLALLKSQRQDGDGQTEDADNDPLSTVRFSARSVRAQRRRLKLSAEEYGKLVGVSPLTIYHWEHGKSRPRRAQLEALVKVRGMGRREALAKLESMEAARKAANRRRLLARSKPK